MTYYVPQERVDEFIKQTQGIEGYNPATEDFIKQLFDENRGAGNWKIVSNEEYYTKYNSPSGVNTNNNTEKDAINSLSNNVSNTKETSETTNTTNTTSTINNQNSNTNVSSNTSVTNNDTINGVTTEEQVPTTESKKEGDTINGVENNINNTVDNSQQDNVSKKDKKEASSKFQELLKGSLKDGEFDKIAKNNTKLTPELLDDYVKRLGYNSVDDAVGNYAALLNFYMEGGNDSEIDPNDPKYGLVARGAAGLAKPLSNLIKVIGKGIGKGTDKLMASAFGKFLAKAGLGYWASAALGTPLMGYDMIANGISEKRTLDKEGNVLPYWKQMLWGLLYGVDKTLLLGLPSSVIELAGNDVPRENIESQQKQIKGDTKARRMFKKSNTYKGTEALNKIGKKYGANEEQLASKIMNNAIAVINSYKLTPDNINQEGWYSAFEYDPRLHNWISKENGETVFDIIEGLSMLDEINGQ